MARTIALAMQKGGVGKTTTALNLGVMLANRGRRVLLVDLDPQANLTQGLGVDLNTVTYSVYEVLLNPEHGIGFATRSIADHLDLIPASLDLAGAELELSGRVGRELLLRKALRAAQNEYDYILFDPPPSLGLFTLNALAAAESVIAPLQLHAYALRALPQLEATIELVREINPPLRLGGIICTMADRRTNLSQQVEQQVRAQYGDLVFTTVIPFTIRLAEAPAAGVSIATFAPNSTGAKAYAELATELEERYGR
ncbi:MAG: sporulation initiation inhibitor Soj [Chloroflexus sp.]|uniref:ParA family protein n=1 Tax=Chloroflexus sp. TaxID=1904827 RepID=UPI0021DCA9BC|nr:ParA family protein [Chloroflexus sp.]GIV89357.1 MAG: sporulation initiation inhibitor Soj [Chloroflexus sp.]